MHKVYSIKKKKYSKKYFVNFVDYTLESIELSLDIIMKFNITKGEELDDNQIETTLNEQRFKDAKLAAYNYVSYKPRSEYEVRNRLEIKGFSTEYIDLAVEFLFEFKLLDDVEYAKTFILNYIRRNPSGKYKLKQELWKRGIEENLVNQSIEEYYPSEQTLDLALKAANKHKKKISHKPKLKQKKLVTDYLSRRGFEWNIINEVIEKL